MAEGGTPNRKFFNFKKFFKREKVQNIPNERIEISRENIRPPEINKNDERIKRENDERIKREREAEKIRKRDMDRLLIEEEDIRNTAILKSKIDDEDAQKLYLEKVEENRKIAEREKNRINDLTEFNRKKLHKSGLVEELYDLNKVRIMEIIELEKNYISSRKEAFEQFTEIKNCLLAKYTAQEIDKYQIFIENKYPIKKEYFPLLFPIPEFHKKEISLNPVESIFIDEVKVSIFFNFDNISLNKIIMDSDIFNTIYIEFIKIPDLVYPGKFFIFDIGFHTGEISQMRDIHKPIYKVSPIKYKLAKYILLYYMLPRINDLKISIILEKIETFVMMKNDEKLIIIIDEISDIKYMDSVNFSTIYQFHQAHNFNIFNNMS